jgi:ectoine hydroxylase-related dioxygenase (phytanoyl-CoA dioxygenase family)
VRENGADAIDLTPAQVAAYWHDGFLLPIRVADADCASGWRDEIESLERRWRDDTALPRPFVDYTRANFHVVSSTAARIAHDPEIVDAVASIIGPDVLCWMTELIVKEPHSPKILTMHQDLTYWGLDGADAIVTAWLALTPARVANGAMRFVRYSHRHGQVAHRDTYGDDNLLSRGQEVAVEYDVADEVPVELDAGEMSLHHGLMFHGSGPNTTDQRRVALVIRYVSPAVAQRVGHADYAMVVRGVNRSRNLLSTPVPFADFTPAALDLHAEISAAQAVPLAADADRPLSYGR